MAAHLPPSDEVRRLRALRKVVTWDTCDEFALNFYHFVESRVLQALGVAPKETRWTSNGEAGGYKELAGDPRMRYLKLPNDENEIWAIGTRQRWNIAAFLLFEIHGIEAHQTEKNNVWGLTVVLG